MLDWKQRIARLLYPYGAVRTVLAGPLRGMRFRVAPGMGISYARGRDHQAAHSFLASRLVHGQTIYDVGANQGQFALLFARMAGPQAVVAFEPVAENVEALRANMLLNGFGTMTLVAKAAGAAAGMARFSYASNSRTMGAFSDRAFKLPDDTPEIVVEVVRLDDLLHEGFPPPSVIKIDVEGAAGDVLAGAEHLLRLHRPSLFVELHLSLGQSFEQDAVSDLIKRHRYQVEMLDGRPWEASRPEGEYHAWCLPGA